jgi:hypothetical protein
MKKVIVALCATVLIVAGCKKDDDNDEIAITKENLAGNYKFSEYSFSYKGRTLNIIDSLRPCNRDDVMTLRTDESYTWADAGTTCSSPSGSFDPGTWRLVSTKKFLWDGDLYDLDKYDGKVLDITQTDIDTAGNLAVLRVTFQKQ